ncbi:MAG: GDSL-type esterase/lipase family protein [Candidatus Coproplasma sp.]
MKVKRLIPIVLSFLMAGTLCFGCNNNIKIEIPEEQPGTEEPGNENPGTEDPGTENPGTEDPGTEDPGTEDPGTEDPGTEDPGTEDPGTEDPGTDEPQASTPLPASNKIYVVGDSTVCSFSDNYYLPRYGYGTQLAEYLNVTSSQIVNLAISGRSSKSFLTEANYTTLTSSISEGDYLIIGFGHNDEKSAEPARFTDPNGTKDVETTSKGTSFKWTLYEKYIKVATDKGATPILCTPIVRYASDGNYEGSKAHITEDGNYPEAIKQLGQETGTAVVDLTALTKAVYEADNANAIYYHAHTTYAGDVKATLDGSETPDGRDDTHINKYGAKMVAYQFANALKSTTCGLAAHVKDEIVAPTKDAEYIGAVNLSFVKTPYTPFNAESNEDKIIATTTTGTTTTDWYKTAMGNLGGTYITEHAVSYNNGTFSLSSIEKSKFESKSDGFGAAFIQISINDNFTASAHIKVNTVGAVKQAGFGMMLRDDILIDTYDASLSTNYVAAGLITNDTAAPSAIWSRSSATALSKVSNTTTCTAGQEYDVSITRTGQTVVVTFADGTNTFTKTYTDFDFVARDNDYMYLCLFANRGFAVEFTNVQFEITGESQGA